MRIHRTLLKHPRQQILVSMSTHYCKAFLILAVLTQACQSSESINSLQHGDLLFQDLNCGDLCDAIEAVTEGVNGRDFSHCGMVVDINDTLMVVEAIGSQVQLNSLADFFRRSGDSSEITNIVVGRVKGDFQPLIEEASAYATRQLGQPYDNVYLLDNGEWYCSELLYESFKAANDGQAFFDLAPMTFKDPTQGDFFPAWVDYYEELQEDIPEGEPGLNPGSISRSDKLDIIDIKSFR